MDYSFSSSAVRQVASDIRNIDATNIKTGAQNVQKIANSIQDVWQGTDANAYINALNNYVPEIEKLSGTLIVIANTLDETAKTMEIREEERAVAAKNLSTN